MYQPIIYTTCKRSNLADPVTLVEQLLVAVGGEILSYNDTSFPLQRVGNYIKETLITTAEGMDVVCVMRVSGDMLPSTPASGGSLMLSTSFMTGSLVYRELLRRWTSENITECGSSSND